MALLERENSRLRDENVKLTAERNKCTKELLDTKTELEKTWKDCEFWKQQANYYDTLAYQGNGPVCSIGPQGEIKSSGFAEVNTAANAFKSLHLRIAYVTELSLIALTWPHMASHSLKWPHMARRSSLCPCPYMLNRMETCQNILTDDL